MERKAGDLQATVRVQEEEKRQLSAAAASLTAQLATAEAQVASLKESLRSQAAALLEARQAAASAATVGEAQEEGEAAR